MLLADVLDARLVERQAGAGQSPLLVEDRGDLLIRAVLGEPVRSARRCPRGAVALGAAVVERHLKLGAGAALPDDLELGAARILFDGHDHLADQRAQQLFAVARRGRLRFPQSRQVAREPGERLALGVGERLGAAGLELGELVSL